MQKYAMLLDKTTGTVQVGMGTNSAFYQKIGMTLMDIEQGYDGNWYLMGYAPAQPVPTVEELAERVRDERDRRITACDWIISRHAEQMALGAATTLTADGYAAWLAYRQNLRDLPLQEGFPWSGGGVDDETCPWPSEPADNEEAE